MGKVIPFPGSKKVRRPMPGAEDFGERLERIRASLEKINRLMADLKQNPPST